MDGLARIEKWNYKPWFRPKRFKPIILHTKTKQQKSYVKLTKKKKKTIK